MSLRNIGLVKAFFAGAAISPARLVKFDTDDRTVIQGAAAADFVFGVSDNTPISAAAAGERVDVTIGGIAPVTYGGTVTRGQLLMSDSTGRAITATAAAGTNIRTAGVAMVSGVVGDVGAISLSPGSFQG
jgi:Uncharacterized conserved protein (DUF2190)